MDGEMGMMRMVRMWMGDSRGGGSGTYDIRLAGWGVMAGACPGRGRELAGEGERQFGGVVSRALCVVRGDYIRHADALKADCIYV